MYYILYVSILTILITVNLSSRTDVQTDVQNVPVDTFNGTLKLRL